MTVVDTTDIGGTVARKATTRAKVKRDGSVSAAEYGAVEALLSQGRNKKQAFEEVAADSDKNPGTVAANYYRFARQTGKIKPRRKRATTAPAARNDDVDAIAKDLVASVQALASAMKAQTAEIDEMRSRLDSLRKVLG
jgi:hypothetical protein